MDTRYVFLLSYSRAIWQFCCQMFLHPKAGSERGRINFYFLEEVFLFPIVSLTTQVNLVVVCAFPILRSYLREWNWTDIWRIRRKQQKIANFIFWKKIDYSSCLLDLNLKVLFTILFSFSFLKMSQFCLFFAQLFSSFGHLLNLT